MPERERRQVVGRLPEALAELLGPTFGHRPACAGRAPAFDLDVAGETGEQRSARHAAAQAVCARCPALPECAAALAELDPSYCGVWAGQVLAPLPRPRARVESTPA